MPKHSLALPFVLIQLCIDAAMMKYLRLPVLVPLWSYLLLLLRTMAVVALALARQGVILPLGRRAWCHWWLGGVVVAVRDGRMNTRCWCCLLLLKRTIVGSGN